MSPSPGVTIASLRLLEQVAEGERISCWKGTWPDGSDGTAHVLSDHATARERENFLAGARRLAAATRVRPLAGVVPIAAVAPTEFAYVTRASVTGTMADVPVLQWGIDKTVRFLGQLCRAMREVHAAGLTHGCARPANVLLDDDLRPVLSDVGMLVIEDSYEGPSDMRHDYAAYAAREVRIGHPSTGRSDIFSLGRLMYFALHGEEPDEADEDLPVLVALQYAPPGLVRIIRRCTVRDASRRYASVDQLLEDLERYQSAGGVGLKHPRGPEGEGMASDRASLTPTSDRPAPPRAALRSLSEEDRVSGTGRHRAIPSPRPSPTGALPSPRPAEVSRPSLSTQAAQVPRPPRLPLDTLTDTGEELLSPLQRRVAIAFGALLFGGALVLSYLRGPSTGVFAASVMGAVVLSLGIPTLGPSPLLSRALAALVLGVATWVLNPSQMLGEWARTRRLSSGTATERGTRVRELYLRGEREFVELDLRGGDFAAADLSGARFDGSDLRQAIFRGAKLINSRFANAQVAGTDFSGADLNGVDSSVMRDWSESRCDASTVMPQGWRCQDGKPTSTTTVGIGGVTSAPRPEQPDSPE